MHLRNPYRKAFYPMGLLAGLGLLAAFIFWVLSLAGLDSRMLAGMGMVFSGMFGLIVVIAWLLGLNRLRQAGQFLESERPLLRWTYTEAEWRQQREAAWQEQSGDWKLQLGLMTLIFGLVGLLAGVMIGLDENVTAAVVTGALGLLLGGLAGALMGAAVAGGSALSSLQEYREAEPGQVALGAGEIYANDDYFRSDGGSSTIRQAELVREGLLVKLEVDMLIPGQRRSSREQHWSIVVPAEFERRMEEMLPVLRGD